MTSATSWDARLVSMSTRSTDRLRSRSSASSSDPSSSSEISRAPRPRQRCGTSPAEPAPPRSAPAAGGAASPGPHPDDPRAPRGRGRKRSMRHSSTRALLEHAASAWVSSACSSVPMRGTMTSGRPPRPPVRCPASARQQRTRPAGQDRRCVRGQTCRSPPWSVVGRDGGVGGQQQRRIRALEARGPPDPIQHDEAQQARPSLLVALHGVLELGPLPPPR